MSATGFFPEVGKQLRLSPSVQYLPQMVFPFRSANYSSKIVRGDKQYMYTDERDRCKQYHNFIPVIDTALFSKVWIEDDRTQL